MKKIKIKKSKDKEREKWKTTNKMHILSIEFRCRLNIYKYYTHNLHYSHYIYLFLIYSYFVHIISAFGTCLCLRFTRYYLGVKFHLTHMSVLFCLLLFFTNIKRCICFVRENSYNKLNWIWIPMVFFISPVFGYYIMLYTFYIHLICDICVELQRFPFSLLLFI